MNLKKNNIYVLRIRSRTSEILKDLEIMDGGGLRAVSYTHLDVYKRQVVQLEQWHPDNDYDRVGIEDKKFETILGVDIPKIILPVKEGRSMAVIIESAVTNFTLSEMGMDSAKEFEQRVLDFIAKNN